MIATVTGTLGDRDGDSVVVLTDSGVGYAVTVPLGVYERLPQTGSRISLYTELVVREDGWALYGFDRPADRDIFRRLLGASGFGPKLAIALLSTLGPERTVRSIQSRDLAALSTVNGIGKKKAEKLIVELQDRFKELKVDAVPVAPRPGDEAVRALTGLGYPPATAEEVVRAVLEEGAPAQPAQLIRRALQRLATTTRGA